MEVDLYALLGSSSTISGTLAPVIPLGLTIDTTKLASGTDGSDFVLGLVSYTDATVANYEGKVTYGSTTSVTLRITRSDSTWSNPGFTANATSPFTFATGDSIRARFTVPIAEWAGSGTCNVAGNDVEYASNSSTTDADDTASLAYGSIGSLVPTITASATNANRTKRVSFQTPIQSGDSIVVEIQDSGTGAWIPVGVNNNYLARTYQNAAGTTAFYGIGWVAVNSTTIDVGFGRAGRITSGTGYGTAGPNYPANAGDKWRVRKTSAGAAVGFGLATSTSAGLVGTGAQSFAGAKTFSNNVLLNANLGIGTTSPGSRVTVIDTVTTTGQTIQVEGSQTSGHVAYLYSNATMAGNVLRVYQDGAGSTASALFAYSDGSEAPITSVSNNSSSYVINAFTNAVASNSNNTKYIRFAGSSGGDDGYIQTNGSAVLSLVDVSDERLKCNIKDASYGLEQIMQLRPVEFNWVTSPSSAPVKGFIAQEVKPILPESVIITATSELKDQHSLETQTMIPVLVKAIQEQQEIIKSLQLKVAALEAKLPA
jgi:hypothetical protein